LRPKGIGTTISIPHLFFSTTDEPLLSSLLHDVQMTWQQNKMIGPDNTHPHYQQSKKIYQY
jgi:hypothetical protein